MNTFGNITMIIGWLLITFAQNPDMIICGRIVEGMSRSFLATCITVITQNVFQYTLHKSLVLTAVSIAMAHPLNFV
jgi:multisubunit Na+/H+ antiporter MnhC subunit